MRFNCKSASPPRVRLWPISTSIFRINTGTAGILSKTGAGIINICRPRSRWAGLVRRISALRRRW